MGLFTIIIPGTLYSFYPWKKQALIINEFGIYTKGYAYLFNETNTIKWANIKRIEIKEPWLLTTGKIKIINTIIMRKSWNSKSCYFIFFEIINKIFIKHCRKIRPAAPSSIFPTSE